MQWNKETESNLQKTRNSDRLLYVKRGLDATTPKV